MPELSPPQPSHKLSPGIDLASASVRLGGRVVLDGLSLRLTEGRIGLLGRNGSGKTTLLRCMAGLQQPTSGATVFEGETVLEPPKKMAVVFQDYSRSLFPWMSVAANVALPLRRRLN